MSDASATELRNMSSADLQREAREQRTLIQKLRTALRLGKEKNTQKYRSAKKQLARMLTVENSKPAEKAPSPATK